MARGAPAWAAAGAAVGVAVGSAGADGSCGEPIAGSGMRGPIELVEPSTAAPVSGENCSLVKRRCMASPPPATSTAGGGGSGCSGGGPASGGGAGGATSVSTRGGLAVVFIV